MTNTTTPQTATISASELEPGDIIVGPLGSRLFIENEVYPSSSLTGYLVIETDIASLYISDDVEVTVER